MKPSKQVRRNPTKKVSSRQPQTRKPKLALEHGRDLKLGRPIGPLLLPGIAGFYDWPDSSLLRFIAEFIAERATLFPDHTDTDAELDLAECIVIARTVRNHPGAESFTFPLPGLAAYRAHTPDETLHYLASKWLEHNAEWKRQGAWFHDPSGGYIWAQVTIVCQTILCRAGVLEKIPYSGPAHRIAATRYGPWFRKSFKPPIP